MRTGRRRHDVNALTMQRGEIRRQRLGFARRRTGALQDVLPYLINRRIGIKTERRLRGIQREPTGNRDDIPPFTPIINKSRRAGNREEWRD